MSYVSQVEAGAIRVAVAMLRALGPTPDRQDVAARMRARLDPEGVEDGWTFGRIVTQALNVIERADQLDSAARDFRLRTREHPIDRGIGPERPRIAYRVVVRSQDSATGEDFDTAVTIRSNTPMTRGEIEAEALSMFQSRQLDRDYRTQIPGLERYQATDVIIIQAARRE